MPKISSLFVELSLDAQNFNNGIKDIERQAKEFSKTVAPMVRAAEDIGKTFTVAGGLVTAAFAGMTKASADYGETLNKANIQTGIATEKLSALKYVAEQEETSFETLSKGLKTMSANANLNSESFKGLGVNVKDAHGQLRPMDDILVDVAKRMSTMADGTTKNAIASEIFGGKMGQELIPLLNRLGKEGLGPAQEMVRQLGLEMSGHTAKAADDFNDSIKEVEDALLGLSNAVASALIPGLTDTSHAMRDGIEMAKDLAKEHEGLTQVIALTGVGLTGTGGLLLGLAGIVTIYPKVVVGLSAINASLATIGVSAITATAGLGAIVYWASQVISTEADLAKTRKETAATTQHANDLIMEQWDRLVKLGIVIDHGTLSWDEFGKAVAAATKEHSAEILKMSQDAKDSVNIGIRTKAEIVEIKRQQAAQLTAIEKDIHEKASVMAGIAHDLNQINLKAEVDAKKKQADELKDIDKLISDFQRSLWQAETGVYNAELKAQAELKKTQGDELKEIERKIAEFNKSVLQVEDAQISEQEKKRKKAERDAALEYQRMGDEFARTFERMTEAASYSVAGMVVHMKLNMDQLKSIAQDTAQSMLGSFIKGLISPLTNELTKLGTKLGDVISGALGIGGKSGGGIGGGGTGNILGKGAGSIGLFGLSGAATLGIGAGALAIGLIAKHFIGEGRRTADEFTGGIQAQFGSDLAEVSAHGTVADLDTLWAQFNKDANSFASQGSNEQKVVNQAHQTLDSVVAQVRRDVGARDAANVVINVTPAPNMDINNLASEILRLFQTDASARAELQALLA